MLEIDVELNKEEDKVGLKLDKRGLPLWKTISPGESTRHSLFEKRGWKKLPQASWNDLTSGSREKGGSPTKTN